MTSRSSAPGRAAMPRPFRRRISVLRTVLIDQEPQLGGVCLLRGCIPSKALLHAARVVSEAEEAQAWGIRFEKPKVDLEAMRARTKTIIGKLTKGVQTLAGSRKVDVIRARATFKNAHDARAVRW